MGSRALLLAGVVALVGCGDDEPEDIIGLDAAPPGPVYETLAEVPATVNRNLDVLFVVDDTMGDQPANLAANLPSLLDVLAGVRREPDARVLAPRRRSARVSPRG